MHSGEGLRMSNRFSLLVAFAAILSASGCGTITNLSENRRPLGSPPQAKPFGGVREDVAFMTETASQDGLMLGVVGIIDLPFSLVGDVFTLPWTLRAIRLRKMCPKESIAVLPEP
jgi:uncharacterized protein YceK